METSTAGSGATTGGPAALGAATLCEAFQLTAAERPEQVALRAAGGGSEYTFAEYADRVRTIAGGPCRARRGPWRHGGADDDQPARVQPGGHRRVPPGRHAVLGLQHVLSRADRIPVLERRQQGRHLRVPVPRDAAGGRRAGARALRDHRRGGRRRHDAGADRGRRDRRLRLRGRLAGRRGRRCPHADLHLGHHGPAEGRGDHAREHDGAVPCASRRCSRWPWAAASSPTCRRHISPIAGSPTTTPGSCTAPRSPRSPTRARWSARCPRSVPRSGARCPGSGRRSRRRWRPRASTDPAGLARRGQGGDPRAKLGLDEVEWLISGAAPIPEEVLNYFGDLGMPICELWGMSELSCCARGQPPGGHPGRHRRQGAAGHRAEAARGRRAARARADRHEGLPQAARQDGRGRSTPTAGCTPATSPRSTTTAT